MSPKHIPLKLNFVVVEALSCLIAKASLAGEIHDIKAGRSCPDVSHLLFADNCLLFSRATENECVAIVRILHDYERGSGKQVNFDKSEVTFSRGVSQDRAVYLASVLGMKLVERHSKYLGVPVVCGRSKKEVFDNVINRVWKKLPGWKEKLLSKAGKEVLIKFVVQSIPLYLMGLFSFPGGVIQKLHSMFARFWWGDKIHWKKWDFLCLPKACGGLGFRRLDIFNQAILAKQAWRIYSQPQSLVAQVFKGKYFPKVGFLQSFLGQNGSFVWKSVWGSETMLE